MQVNSNGYNQANINAFKENTPNNQKGMEQKAQNSNDIKTRMERSAAEVALSMNAQIILFSMDASQLNKENITAQKDIFTFLSGGQAFEGFKLEDIGYEGKPITELSVDEANSLLDEGGFFSVEETSNRVANFVFSFAGNDIDILKEGLEGIKRGFEEAQELWQGELPDISYQTQSKTVQLIEERIAQLQAQEAQQPVQNEQEVE
jgi:hypothetical protein